jgi:hypothetical protein
MYIYRYNKKVIFPKYKIQHTAQRTLLCYYIVITINNDLFARISV